MDQGQVLFEGVRILLDLLGHKDWRLQILRLKEALAMANRCESPGMSSTRPELRESSGWDR